MKASMWVGGAVALALACLSAVGEQEKESKEPADLAWLPSKAALVVSVRPADLWKGELGKALLAKLDKDEKPFTTGFAKEFGLPPAEIERLTFVVPDLESVPAVYVRAAKAVDGKKLLAALVPNGVEKKSGDRAYTASASQAAAILGEREYVVGRPAALEGLLAKKPNHTADGLGAAIALAKKGHVLVAGTNPSAVAAPDADLPKELEEYRPLLKAKHATVALDLGEKWSAKLRVAFGEEEDAKKGEKALSEAQKEGRTLLATLTKKLQEDRSDTGKALVGLLDYATEALKSARVARTGKEVGADVGVKVDSARIAAFGAQIGVEAREAATRAQNQNNLKQLGLAMHNYHDALGTLPAHAVYDKNGKALLSWRVLILPYIEQKELYEKFKLDEPWDSKHNKPLLAKIPAVFRGPEALHKKSDTTFYLGLVGKGAAFEGKKGLAFTDFTDGLSNTIMIVEGGKEVPWTKPEDLDFDENKDLPKLGGLYPGGFNALVGDGSVRFLKTNNKQLKALITRNGGEAIANDQ